MNIFKFAVKSLELSPTRYFEYDKIHNMRLSGKVLDLGGGKNSYYPQLFKGDFSICSLNIDPNINPTIIADITKKFPLKNEEFDYIISFNTFEHISEFEDAFLESFRVLKKGGVFIFSTPFLKEVHSSPDDYWRFTGSALDSILKKTGFSIDGTSHLGKGIFIAQYSLIYGALPTVLKPIFALIAYCLDSLFSISDRYKKIMPNYALAYLAIARKD